MPTPAGFYSPCRPIFYRNESFWNDRLYPAADCGQYPVHDLPDHGHPFVLQAVIHSPSLTIWLCSCLLARNFISYISQFALCLQTICTFPGRYLETSRISICDKSLLVDFRYRSSSSVYPDLELVLKFVNCASLCQFLCQKHP